MKEFIAMPEERRRLVCTEAGAQLNRRRRRHYSAQRGSDDGAHPVNRAGLRRDFEVTMGFCVHILPPSIDFIRGHCVYSGD